MKVKLNYLYCDGDNYKNSGSVLFAAGPAAAAFNFALPDPEQLNANIKEHLEEGCFIAHQVGIPEVFLWNADASYDPDDESTHPPGLKAGMYRITEADHSWHRFDSFELVADEDVLKMVAAGVPLMDQTVSQFVDAVVAANSQGWDEFEPDSRRRRAVLSL